MVWKVENVSAHPLYWNVNSLSPSTVDSSVTIGVQHGT